MWAGSCMLKYLYVYKVVSLVSIVVFTSVPLFLSCPPLCLSDILNILYSLCCHCLSHSFPAYVLSCQPNAELHHFHCTLRFKYLLVLLQRKNRGVDASDVSVDLCILLFVVTNELFALFYHCLLASFFRIIYQRRYRVYLPFFSAPCKICTCL